MREAGLFWFLVGTAAGTALLLVGVPLLVVAIALFKRPRPWHPVLRRVLAGLLLTVDAALLAVTLAAFLAPRLCDRLRLAYVMWSQTYHLTAPRTLAGVRFPAGSTVFMDGDDIDHGTVPVPTVIAGLPIVGEFVAHHDAVAFGTLAVPAEVVGVPCAPGGVSFSTEGNMSCVLGRDFAFAGHDLAPGQPIRISVIEGFGRWLDLGTLAHPERLFGVLWPAGSVLSGIQDEAARPPGSPGLPELRAEVCLLSNETVQVAGATLHGTITYWVLGGKSGMVSGCNHLDRAHRVGSRDGYAEMGADRYAWGEHPGGDAPWRWGNGENAGEAR